MFGSILRHALRITNEEGILSLLMRVPAFLHYSIIYISDLFRIHTLKRNIGIDKTIDRVSSLKTVYMIQKRVEINAFLVGMEKMHPAHVLEIGTAGGGTLLLLARISTKDATIISIDLPKGMFGGGYPDYNIPLYQSFTSPTQTLHLLRADSHDQSTLNQVQKMIGNSSLDLLFIDGDHSYEGVKQDFAMYSKLVRDGGVIAFHDIAPGDTDRAGGVHKFWDEIKNEYPHEEFVDNWAQGGYGIGFVTYSRKSPVGPITPFGKE